MQHIYTEQELLNLTIKTRSTNLHSICRARGIPFSTSERKGKLIEKILKAQGSVKEEKKEKESNLLYLQKHCKEMENMIDVLYYQFATLKINIPTFLQEKIIKQIISDEETCYVCMENLSMENIKFDEHCGHYCCDKCFVNLKKCGICK